MPGSFTFADGLTVREEMKIGGTVFAETVEHVTESGGNGEVQVLLVELD